MSGVPDMLLLLISSTLSYLSIGVSIRGLLVLRHLVLQLFQYDNSVLFLPSSFLAVAPFILPSAPLVLWLLGQWDAIGSDELPLSMRALSLAIQSDALPFPSFQVGGLFRSSS